MILNPAPARSLPDTLLKQVSILTPNEKEAELLTGIVVKDDDSALQAARVLSERGVGTVIVTLGKRGALVLDAGAFALVASPAVEAVDTTGAGDVFNGALAVGLGEGMSMDAAVGFACHAAALSVTKLGAQASAPGRRETAAFMKKLLLVVLFLAAFGFGYAQNKPLPVIFDTDMGPDYDDVGAIALLHAFADSGKARILATMLRPPGTFLVIGRGRSCSADSRSGRRSNAGCRWCTIRPSGTAR